jgi:hypothetical protein
VLWVQIRIQIRIGSGFNEVLGSVSGSGFAIRMRIRIQEGTYDPEKKLRNFIFRTAGCSLLRAEGFSCSLDVLYEGISKLQFLIKKRYKKVFSFFSPFFGHKNPGYLTGSRSVSGSGFT